MASKMVIIICGLAGSGKSVLADKLSAALELHCVHASDILRQLRDKKMSAINAFETKQGKGFWESAVSRSFNQKRLENLDLDKQLDQKLLEIVSRGGVVMDSWTLPWLSKKGFKVWLKVSDEARFKRIALRDGVSLEKTRKAVRQKEHQTIRIYKDAYGFDFGSDLKPFHLVLDTTPLSEQQVLDKVRVAIQKARQNGFFVQQE